jgi:hypothetical protein
MSKAWHTEDLPLDLSGSNSITLYIPFLLKKSTYFGRRDSPLDEIKISQQVREYYWQHDLNCATTTLKILAEQYSIDLSDQVLDSAIGMHGAGKYGAQCGLVEGTLLFLGILGRVKKLSHDDISALCCRYAGCFEGQFSSLQCSELRPEGFAGELPPHLCEDLTCRAIAFSSQFLEHVVADLDD